MFRGRVKSTCYPLHSASFPITSPPVRHHIPSHFTWSLPATSTFLYVSHLALPPEFINSQIIKTSFSFTKIPLSSFLHGLAVTQTVCRKSVTADSRIRSKVSPCEICGRESLPLSTSGISLSVLFHQCSILISFIILLPEGQAGEAWETSNQCYAGYNFTNFIHSGIFCCCKKA